MSWTYRVLRRVFDDGTEQFGIHEVYYGKHGCAESCTEDPVVPVGDTLDDLKQAAFMWLSAFRDGVVMEYSGFEDQRDPEPGEEHDKR